MIYWEAMDGKLITIMVLIYFSKAFDSIDHDVLLNKLWNIGMTPSALEWYSSYL
jgi:mannitol/fructose-specific phosphotransferase system IIA component (Ntr-type)